VGSRRRRSSALLASAEEVDQFAEKKNHLFTSPGGEGLPGGTPVVSASRVTDESRDRGVSASTSQEVRFLAVRSVRTETVAVPTRLRST